MAKKKPILRPVLFIMTLSAVLGLFLALLHGVSREKIEMSYNFDVQKAILYTVNIDTVEKSESEINNLFKEYMTEEKLGGVRYFVFHEDGVLKGYSFPFLGEGLWGSISGYIAVDPDGEYLLGVVFTKHSETPGLGGLIDELWYKEQFRGLDITGIDNFIFYKVSDPTGLDAITGATTTSNSVRDFLNRSIVELKTIIKEELRE